MLWEIQELYLEWKKPGKRSQVDNTYNNWMGKNYT